MRSGNKCINILIVIEAIVLILVLVLAGVTRVTSGLTASGDAEGAAESGDSDNSGDASADADENAVLETSDSDADAVYEEERITFDDEVEELLASMTEAQLAAQLFVTTPEELTGIEDVTVAGESTQAALTDYPVAGLVYSAQNFEDASQTSDLLEGTAAYAQEITGAGIFLMVEELGGEDASPVAQATGYDVTDSPADLAAEGDTDAISEAAAARADYLAAQGFTTVLGPYAVTEDTADASLGDVLYGTSEDEIVSAADYVAADIEGLLSGGIGAVVRAYPGVSTASYYDNTYVSAIDAGASIIQIGNVTDSTLTGDEDTLCTMSAGTTLALRDAFAFDGLLMTADLAEDAVTDTYSVGEAAVKAIQSGMNLIYITDGFAEAYDAVLEAIESGDITQDMLENAVGRVLTQTTAL